MKIGIITFCNTKFDLQMEHLFFDDWNNLIDMHKFLKFFLTL